MAGTDSTMLTWTDQPYATMWAHLRVLSHVHNAKRLLLNQLGGTRNTPPPAGQLLDQKAAQLSYCVLQADEYFRAAESVSVNTSPLLYFYGMLSLAKATVVANDPQKLLDDVKYHGLHHDKLRRAATVEDQLAIVNGGVFDELMDVVLGYRVPKGSAFRFRDVLAISPELSKMYERHFAVPPRWIYLYSHELSSKDPYKLKVCVIAKDEEEVLSVLPEFSHDFDRHPGLMHGQAICFSSKTGVEEAPCYFRIYSPVVGGRYLVGSLSYSFNGSIEKCYVSPPLSDYILMYILSDCVRYQQELWGNVVQGRQTGILGLIELAIAIARRRFPNMVLNELYGEPFEYGTPSRMM
jgi:hypothetical protein